MRGVWGGNRGRIPVRSLDDPIWEGHTTAAPLGPPDNWGVSATRAAMRVHFVHRHIHDIVVILEEGNLPPTTVPPVRPPGLQEGAQWAPPGEKPVQNGRRTQNLETCGGGGGGSDREGFQSLREEVRLGKGVPLPREGLNRHGR